MFQFIVLLVLSLIAAGAISTGAKDFIKNLLVIGGVIFFAQLAGNPFHQAFDQGVPIAGGSGLTQKNVSLKLPDKPPESLRGKVRFWAAQYRVDPQLFFCLGHTGKCLEPAGGFSCGGHWAGTGDAV